MNRVQKADIVAELSDKFGAATCLYLADYRGLSVMEATALRVKCREGGVSYRVIKNTLARLALAGTEMEPLSDSFSGPVAVAWTDGDPLAPAKILADFAKDNDSLELKSAFVEGSVLSADEVNSLAKLPGKDALRSQLLSILTAPMQQLVSVLAAPARDVVGVIDAYAKKIGE